MAGHGAIADGKLVMKVGGLAGAQAALSPGLATAPIASMFLGTAAATFPASIWMSRVGRRRGLVLGAALGAVGGLMAAPGVGLRSLAPIALGTFVVGTCQGFARFYRFATGEVADDAFRPRAISHVLVGGIIAALAGPALARLGEPLLEPRYAGFFVLLAAVSAVAAGMLLRFRVPAPHAEAGAASCGRPGYVIVLQPAYLVALFGAATGYGIMILTMTVTPIAMMQHHHDLAAASTVIQLHVLGMFLPSFFTGSLIARFGVLWIMLTGLGVRVATVLTAVSGTGFGALAVAPFLVGVGWNFLYRGGTTLLSTTWGAAEPGRAQAINDMTVFAVGLACSLGAGGLLQGLRW